MSCPQCTACCDEAWEMVRQFIVTTDLILTGGVTAEASTLKQQAADARRAAKLCGKPWALTVGPVGP